MGASPDLQAAAQQALRDCSRFVLFDSSGAVLASSLQASPAELQQLLLAFGDRDEAIRRGMTIQGIRYEVHRHHPPLVYGRTMGVEPEASEGAAICRVDDGITGTACYGAITYQMPNISARMVPILQACCKDLLERR